MGSRIIGTGRGVPAASLTNQDLERQLDTSDEWIRSRTGIASRYLMRTGEGLLDIAVQASRRALDKAGMKAGELDAIVAGTVSSEYAFPSFACQVQRELGVTSIPAFDVAAACSGFRLRPVGGRLFDARRRLAQGPGNRRGRACPRWLIGPTAAPRCCSATGPAPW